MCGTRAIFSNRMVLQRISCEFVKGLRHAHVGRNEPRGNKNFQRFYTALPRLTPQEVCFKSRVNRFSPTCVLHTVPFQVTNILQANEYTKEFSVASSVKYYDSNQLASNNPIEDTRSEAQCLLTKGTVKCVD